MYECDKCGREIAPDEIGYLGPKDRESEECNPFMEIECLCMECERIRAIKAN